MNKLEDKKFLDFCKIFSDEERRKIFFLLLQNKYCVCELVGKLQSPQNLVSYHLKYLKNFNLIFLKKIGRKNFYFVNKKELNKYLKLINKLLS